MISESSKRTLHIIFKFLLLISIPIILSSSLMYFFPISAFSLKKEEIIMYLSQFKNVAPIIYILLQTSTVLIVPIPSVILATAAGTIFNFWYAVCYTTIAWILGTSINFFIARIGGRLFMKKLMSQEELNKIDKFAEHIGWKFIFLSWFIPGGTADVAGYAAGLTKMNYRKYFPPALVSAFLLSLLTSAAGSAFAVSPLLTSLFTIGAIVGIIFGAKIVIIFSVIKNKFFHQK